MPIYYIISSDLDRMIDQLAEKADVFAPQKKNDNLFYSKVTAENISKIVYDGPRATLPIKSFFFAPRESAGEYFNGQETFINIRQRIIIGVSACDIKALKILDEVFLKSGIIDPFYEAAREKNLVISSDCAYGWPSCFCTLLGFEPHPEEGFDINLTKAKGGFLVEVGSKKGEELFEEFRFFFREATPEELSYRESSRAAAAKLVKNGNSKFKFKEPLNEIVKNTLERDVWRDIARDCVECGACNLACPTCTCFMLYDIKKGSGSERVKIWDACLKAGYARVAGGGNPRPKYFERLNNRFQCKFDYMHRRHGFLTCVGCGRCIDACMAKIDMRDALARLEADLALSAKLE